MDYTTRNIGDVIECRIKCTYVELYALQGEQYEFIHSIQKKNFDDIIGLAVVSETNDAGLVPITITSTVADAIVNSSKTKDFRKATIIRQSKNILYAKPVALDCELMQDEVEIEDVYVDDTPYDESTDKKSKDYSKLIWMALAAAALAL